MAVIKRPGGGSPRLRWQWVVGISIASVTAHVALRGADQTIVAGVYSGLIGALFLTLAHRYAMGLDRLPFLEGLLLMQWTEYGLAITSAPRPVGVYDVVPSAQSYELAAGLSLLAAVALTVGFATSSAMFRRLENAWWLPNLDGARVYHGARRHFPAAAVYALGTTISTRLIGAFGSLGLIVDGLFGFTALMVITAMAYALSPNAGTRLRLYVALALVLLGVFATSVLSAVAYPVLASALVLHGRIRRIPWIPIFAAVAVIVALQPVKGYYRAIRWREGGGSVSATEAWKRAFADAAADRPQNTDAEATRDRLGELPALAYTVELVPNVIPHTGGRTYEILLAAIVPRLIWPNKPDMTKFGQDVFTNALGLSSFEGAQTTTTGLPIVAHGYFEHGPIGSIGWMFAIGILMAIASQVFPKTIAGQLGGMVIIPAFMSGSASGMVGLVGSYWQSIVLGLLVPWSVYALGMAKNTRPIVAHPQPT